MKKSRRKIVRCYFCEQPILRGQRVCRSPDGKCVMHDSCAVELIHDYKGKKELEKN